MKKDIVDYSCNKSSQNQFIIILKWMPLEYRKLSCYSNSFFFFFNNHITYITHTNDLLLGILKYIFWLVVKY